MHFIDKAAFSSAPTAKLNEYNDKHQQAWAKYNSARFKKLKPTPSKPPSSWRDDAIRIPLAQLFLKNCGYCGIHADIGSDAEVDHYHPTSKDPNADLVFEWDNYIWSCPGCNGLKRDHHPFLNPSVKADVEHIYFHQSDGRYLLYQDAPAAVKDKYALTVGHSKLNESNRPASRKYLCKEVELQLKDIKLYSLMFDAECTRSGKDSAASQKKRQDLEQKKAHFLALIRSGNYLLLIKFLVVQFKREHEAFPYSFAQLLAESDYLEG